ncbi:site-specific integrase [Streptomyces sp. NBC_00237]|uniref:site-specific integrase n=1 Tax=Streptomyces sp. NBC_00237 TaxID=2975687 RepID=UPI0022510173|nr:site-specific integrase [Streptomyces sp. NBC_00237]MCX5205098.1 site-specific integrase [Streptomyces sp. NBC_00237]
MAFDGSIYRRCKCTTPKLDDEGHPVLDAAGNVKVRELGSSCPELEKRDHGSWYYYVKLPDSPSGERRRPRKGGFVTRTLATKAAQRLWDLSQDGIDVDSRETVSQYLHRWLDKRLDLKQRSRTDYRAYIDSLVIPAIGNLQMRELRDKHIQAMFQQVWRENEERAINRQLADEATLACQVAHDAWRAATRPRPPELRARWNEAKAARREAMARPRRETGPGTQRKIKDMLAGALKDAVAERLISQNWTKNVSLPTYRKPEPLVWTRERVIHWQETGTRPGPVMVWTPDQIGQFLDGAVTHRLYTMFHLMIFRGTRRGETAGLRWSETNLEAGTIRISEQLVTGHGQGVWTDTPKSRSGKRTITLDAVTKDLLLAWRSTQQELRKEREPLGIWQNTGYVFTYEDGRPYHPDNISQIFEALIKRLGLPPIRLHDLRHCAASLSLAAGLSMKAIQILLGHSSYVLTAQTYTSLMPQFAQAEADAPVALVPRQTPTAEGQQEGSHLTLVPRDETPGKDAEAA